MTYAPLFRALVFSVSACGFSPRSALELDDGGQARIEKLFSLIGACRYGIHDLSRTELDPKSGLPRFNMPLELGIFLGAKRYGPGEQRTKRLLILDVEPYRYRKFISDLAGIDIHQHSADPVTALKKTRNWLANVSRRQLPSADRVARLFLQFTDELPAIATALEFDPADIPYVDFETIVAGWIANAQPSSQ
jgi:hypothetical protein